MKITTRSYEIETDYLLEPASVATFVRHAS